MWAKIITIKRTKDLNYFRLCALNLFNTQVSQIEFNYWNELFDDILIWDAPVYNGLRLFYELNYDEFFFYIFFCSLALSLFLR